MKRKAISRSLSRKIFRKTAANPLKINTRPTNSRGGIRL